MIKLTMNCYVLVTDQFIPPPFTYDSNLQQEDVAQEPPWVISKMTHIPFWVHGYPVYNLRPAFPWQSHILPTKRSTSVLSRLRQTRDLRRHPNHHIVPCSKGPQSHVKGTRYVRAGSEVP